MRVSPRSLILSGLSLLAVGLIWAGWQVFVAIVMISGTPGNNGGAGDFAHWPPLALAATGILAMIASRFIQEDP